MRRAFLGLLVLACGRTHLLEDAVDGGLPDAAIGVVSDAGLPDAGVGGLSDGGNLTPWCPAPPSNSGRVWGTTPLGPIDFPNAWTGTEGPWGHSCPHLTVVASPGPRPDQQGSFTVDFNYASPPVLGSNHGVATLLLAGKTAKIDVTVNVTRADGLTGSSSAMASWRTSLTFAAADGGWTLQGALNEVPDCIHTTWYCL